MAIRQINEHSYILMRDMQGEKKSAMTGSLPKSVQVSRGELLTSIVFPERDRTWSRNDGKSAHNFRSKKDPSVTLYGGEENNAVAPVKGKELQLLEAIEKPYERFAMFSEPNRLDQVSTLRKGDQVFVKISTPNAGIPAWSKALVQYTGPVEGLPGWNFGVEIKVTSVYTGDINIADACTCMLKDYDKPVNL